MKNKALSYCAAVIPLVAVNGFCLAANYFETGNAQVNITVALLFLMISALIAVTKLFFDFFVAIVTLKVTSLELASGRILDRLLQNMLPQWLITAACLAVSRLLFPGAAAQTDLITFAVAHTVYYLGAAHGLNRETGRKLFYSVYGCAAAVCWGYAIFNLVKLAAA